MVPKTSWRQNPETICRRLDKIEHSTSTMKSSSTKAVETLIAKMEKVFKRIEQEGVEGYAFGGYRIAAEHYDRLLKTIIQKSTNVNNDTAIAGLLSFFKNKISKDVFNLLEKEPAFLSLTAEERELRCSLSKYTDKKLAHLFGNQIVKDKSDSFGGALEGLPGLFSIEFFFNLIKLASVQHPSIFSEENNEWKTIKKVMSQGLCYAHLFACAAQSPIDLRHKLHQAISEKMLRVLDALSEGESLSFPWGWIASANPGHAMFVIIEKKSSGYQIELYNTGGKAGEYHDSLRSNGVDMMISRIVYKVSEDKVAEFRTFLKHMIEPTIYGNIRFNEKFPKGYENPFWGSNEYTANELFSYLSQYERVQEDNRESDLWTRGNVSGICSYKVLLAVLKYKAKDFYDPFKVFSQSEVLRLLFRFENYFIAPNETTQMLISHALSNLARHYNKIPFDAPQKKFTEPDELQRWNERLDKLLRPSTSIAPSLGNPQELTCIAPCIKEACLEAVKPVEPKNTVVPKRRTTFTFLNPQLHLAPEPLNWSGKTSVDAAVYCKQLEHIAAYAQDCSTRFSPGMQYNQPALLVDSLLRECYRPFLDPSLRGKAKE